MNTHLWDGIIMFDSEYLSLYRSKTSPLIPPMSIDTGYPPMSMENCGWVRWVGDCTHPKKYFFSPATQLLLLSGMRQLGFAIACPSTPHPNPTNPH